MNTAHLGIHLSLFSQSVVRVALPLFLIFPFLLFPPCAAAQPHTQLYIPDEDASAALGAAVTRAQHEGKHVHVQVGANWCSWCIKLGKLMTSEARIDSRLQSEQYRKSILS